MKKWNKKELTKTELLFDSVSGGGSLQTQSSPFRFNLCVFLTCCPNFSSIQRLKLRNHSLEQNCADCQRKQRLLCSNAQNWWCRAQNPISTVQNKLLYVMNVLFKLQLDPTVETLANAPGNFLLKWVFCRASFFSLPLLFPCFSRFFSLILYTSAAENSPYF